jgi:hypothetical protein
VPLYIYRSIVFNTSPNMKSHSSILLKLLMLQCLSLLCVSQDFDFFYFVQQVMISEFCSCSRLILGSLKNFISLSVFTNFSSIVNIYSGQHHTVTHKKVVATQPPGSLHLILASTGFGQITRMARTRQTVIPTAPSINLR